MSFLLALEDIKMRSDGWANQTTAQPIGIALLLMMIIVIMAAPRRFAVLPFFILACFAARQRVVIASLDFDFIRLLVVFGWLRVFSRLETRGFKWKGADTVFAGWCIAGFVAPIILFKTTSIITVQLGQLLTIAGGYFLFRQLVRTWDDVFTFVRGAVIIGIPVCAMFMIEKFTARNYFASFGGIPPLTQIRNGEIRAQGGFAHPILAGAFWASMAPLFAALWWKKGIDTWLAIIGVFVALFISWACASSTPLVAVMAATFAGGMFFFRDRMRTVRWGILGVLIFLQIVKTKPVWHMFVYADLIGGSTGWHRYNVIDKAIKNFSQWAMFGTPSTANWGFTDITNHFVLEGVRGGFLTLVLAIWIMVMAFGGVGRLWRLAEPNKAQVAMAWALGACMFAHLTSFLAVAYFGQIVTLFGIHVAMIASLAPGKRAFLKQQRAATIAGRRRVVAKRAESQWTGQPGAPTFARDGGAA